jgi:hypothetical protein
MNNQALPKGQRVTTPQGPGYVVEVIGKKVAVKLDNGQTQTFPLEDVSDDSSAG